jgi:hypothetical protein
LHFRSPHFDEESLAHVRQYVNPIPDIFLLDKSEKLSHIMAMRTQITQSDIAVQALQLGAGLTAVAKWRDRGIPESWRWRLKDHFSAKQLDDFRSLPEKRT